MSASGFSMNERPNGLMHPNSAQYKRTYRRGQTELERKNDLIARGFAPAGSDRRIQIGSATPNQQSIAIAISTWTPISTWTWTWTSPITHHLITRLHRGQAALALTGQRSIDAHLFVSEDRGKFFQDMWP